MPPIDLDTTPEKEYEHLKPRYDFRETCAIFGVHAKTLRVWMKRGVPLPNGERIRLPFVPLGMRNTILHQEDVDRIQVLRTYTMRGGARLYSLRKRRSRRGAAANRSVTGEQQIARVLAWRPKGGSDETMAAPTQV